MDETIHYFIGRDADTIRWWQMAIRAFVIFLVAVLFVRVGGTRAFGGHTSFDIVLAVLLGSSLSRALTGNASLFPTLAACAVLISLHSLLAQATIRSSLISRLVKGRPTAIVEDGQPKLKAMNRMGVGMKDVEEAARKAGQDGDLSAIRKAYLERNGEITVILK